MNGLCFATLSWNLYSTKVWCWAQAVVPFCPLRCPFLRGGKQPSYRWDLPSTGSQQTLSLLHLLIQTVCHCHLHSCSCRAVLETRLPQLLMLGSVCYIQLRSQVHLSGPCCWQSRRLEGCFAMHWICVKQYHWYSSEAVLCLAQAAPGYCESEQSLSTELFSSSVSLYGCPAGKQQQQRKY